MVARIITALVGGSAITIAMLLGMHEATRHFEDLDPTRYFSIVDFIPAPETSGRPRPPPAPAAPPNRPSVGYEHAADARVPFERPVVEDDRPAPTTAPAPRLDPELNDTAGAD